MAVTPNMGLVKWSELSDPYDHTQLSGNFQKIDEHDHTATHGVQIPTGGIKDLALTTAKYEDKSVTNAKLADGVITADKMASGVVSSLGDIKLWWRPNEATSLPEGGWAIAEGQSLIESQHDFPGGGTIILPNLIERFIRGSNLASLGSTGGVSSVNLAHSHGVNAHTHHVGSHDHGIELESGFGASTNLKISQDLSGNAWVHSDDHNNAQHRHSINGNVQPTEMNTDGATSSTDSKLGSTNIIPPYIGLLPLIKVKNG